MNNHSANSQLGLLFQGPGEMRALSRAFDWSTTSLGPVAQWSQPLRTATQLVLASPFPMILLWGPELIQIYNDGYRELMGNRHPAGLGQPTRQCWPEVWHINEPIYRQVWAGESFSFEDALYPITRSGQLQDAWFTLAYSPVLDESGQVGGILITVLETTRQVMSQRHSEAAQEVLQERQRQQDFLLTLSDSLRAETGVEAVGHRATQLMAQQLGADRVYLVSLNPDDDTVVVSHETRRQGMLPLQGSYRSSDFPAAIKEIFERTIVYTDVRTDDRLTELDRLSFAGLGAVGFMAASLRRGSQTMIWAAGAVSSGPRSWTASEVVMFEDAVERTWAAVERARAEAALRKSEEKYRSLFNSIDEGFVEMEMLMDEAGRVVDWRWLDYNPAFERMSGLTGKKGQLFSEIVPQLEPEWAERYGYVVATGEALRFELPVGGLDSWFDIFVSRVGEEGDRKVVCVFNNITERKRHEASLSFLAEVSQDLAGLTNIDETMTALGAKIAGYFKLAEVVFGEMSDDEQTVHISHEWHRADYLAVKGTYAIKAYYSPEFEGLHRAGQIVVVRDTANDERVDAAGYAALGIGAFVNVPLMRQNKWLFNITLVDANPRDWREDEIDLMRELTTRIWMRLESARAEEALLDSQKRFESIANLVPDLLWDSQPDGSTNWYNQRWLEYTGQRFEEAIGWGWKAAIHPDDREASARQYEEAVESGTSLRQEHRIRRYDGAYRWFVVSTSPFKDERGQVVRMYGAATDIHESKLAEAAVQESEKRFRLAIEATELATWEWNLDTNQVYWNEQHFRLFGMEPQPNPIGPDVFMNHVHPSERERVSHLLQQAIAERTVYNTEFCALLEDGSTRYMSGYGRIVEERAGQPLLISGVMFDVDERRRTQDALRAADQRKDEFLAMLAHELRNPMATIRSGLQILTITDGKDQTSRDTIAMMNRQTDHLVRMVDDLLDVGRITQGKIELRKERVNLVSLVQQAVASSQSLFEEQGKRLQVNLPSTSIYLEGDATRLSQVVTNLLTNGVRYTGEQGQVWLSLSHHPHEAILRVRDNGIGLGADQLSSIFELFVQVDHSTARSKGGLGLGLTLVKRLVALHGGHVEAQSDGLGRGSIFTVHLPTLPVAAEPTATSTPQASDSKPSRRILVIDDDADAAFTLAMLLRLTGYEVHTRNSGRTGLEAAEALQPAAILLDIGMPELDGYETCRLLREQAWGQAVVVIALTGYGQAEDRQRTKAAGFDGHLVKPVDLGALTKLLMNLLNKDLNST